MSRQLLLMSMLFMVSSYSCAMEQDRWLRIGELYRRRLVPVLFAIPGTWKLLAGVYKEKDVERLIVFCRRNYPGKEKLTLYIKDRSGHTIRREISL